jgi:predicted nucleotidyltransferase
MANLQSEPDAARCLITDHALSFFSMTSMADVQRLVNKIARVFRPEKIVLFGSYARGEAGPDSDVDLLVVMDHEGHSAGKAAEITARLHPGSFSLDLIVRNGWPRRTQTSPP